MYRIVKGLPVSFAIALKHDGEYVDLNDGTWKDVTVSIHYQTATGSEPFVPTVQESGEGWIVSMTPEQTALLNHRADNYAMVIRVTSVDDLINLKSVVWTAVTDDV